MMGKVISVTSLKNYQVTLSLAYAFTLAWRFNKELVFFHQMFQPQFKVSVDVFYCIVTTKEDHRSVVETFGEKGQVLC